MYRTDRVLTEQVLWTSQLYCQCLLLTMKQGDKALGSAYLFVCISNLGAYADFFADVVDWLLMSYSSRV